MKTKILVAATATLLVGCGGEGYRPESEPLAEEQAQSGKVSEIQRQHDTAVTLSGEGTGGLTPDLGNRETFENSYRPGQSTPPGDSIQSRLEQAYQVGYTQGLEAGLEQGQRMSNPGAAGGQTGQERGEAGAESPVEPRRQ